MHSTHNNSIGLDILHLGAPFTYLCHKKKPPHFGSNSKNSVSFTYTGKALLNNILKLFGVHFLCSHYAVVVSEKAR